MPVFNFIRQKFVLILAALFIFADVCIYAGAHGINILNQPYEVIAESFGLEKSPVVASVNKKIHRVVGAPDVKVETTEVDIGGGRHKVVVSRGGKTRDYLVRSEIWNEYMDIGGEESVVGSPTSNEYTWCDGKRQDFERGHWLYWSEKTGVVMDYTPYTKPIKRSDTKLQAPVFYMGKPVVEWTDHSQNAYHLTQDFGENGHLGQDLALNGNPNPGYEVRPIAEGTVVLSGWTGSNAWGYMVLVRHSLKNDRHYFSQYAHLYDLPQVFTGQQVNRETILGYVGNTGKSTGPHLDLQIKELAKKGNRADFDLQDIGSGYTRNRTPFNGNLCVDSETGIVYYKPSYFIENFDNGSILIDQSPEDQKAFVSGEIALNQKY